MLRALVGTAALTALTLIAACPAAPDVDPPARCLTRVAPNSSDSERGVLVMLAGDSSAGYSDGSNARTNGVGGVAVAGDGLVLFTDIFNGTIRALDEATGEVATVAGFPLDVGAVDGGCGEARLNGPRGLAVHPIDTQLAFFGDGPCVRRLDVELGAVTTIAGDCATPGNINGVGADARFGFLLHDLEISADGRIFVADRNNDALRVVDIASGTVTTLVSEGLNGPGGMALDGDTLYVANTFDHIVITVDIASGETLRLAGRRGDPGSLDGPQGTGTMTAPQALAKVGDVIVAAGFDGGVRSIDARSGLMTTLTRDTAGFFAPFAASRRGIIGGTLDNAVVRVGLDGTVAHVFGPRGADGYRDGAGAAARFSLPVAVADARDGTVVVTDAFNQALRRVRLDTGETSTIVGGPGDSTLTFPTGVWVSADGARALICDNGADALVEVELASGLATTKAVGLVDAWEVVADDAAGSAYVVLGEDKAVVKVDLATGAVTPLAAELVVPFGLALVDGRLFVSDNEEHTVSELDLVSGGRSVLLGTPGFQGSADGPKDVALLNFPAGLDGRVEDGAVVLYLAETGGQTARRIDVATGESRFVVGDPFLSGGLPAGARVALAGAPLLNPNDVSVVGADVIVVGDTTVVAARP